MVLCPGAANRGEFRIAVNVEFDLALSPPTVGKLSPRQIRAHIVTRTLDTLQNDMFRVLPLCHRAPPLGVKISGVFGNFG